MASARQTLHIRILATLLSRPPRPGAGIVATLSLLVLMAGCALHWGNFGEIAKFMSANRDLVFTHGEVWRLLTTLFVHADLGHVLSNSLLYFILSYLLYGYFGWRVYPLLAWLLTLPMTSLALLSYPSTTHLIGASGLVHLMGGLWLSLYLGLARNLRLTQRLIRAAGVMLAIFFPTSFEETVSYRVHFIGLLLGLVGGWIYFQINRRSLQAFEEISIELDPDDAPMDVEFDEQSAEMDANPDLNSGRRFDQ